MLIVNLAPSRGRWVVGLVQAIGSDTESLLRALANHTQVSEEESGGDCTANCLFGGSPLASWSLCLRGCEEVGRLSASDSSSRVSCSGCETALLVGLRAGSNSSAGYAWFAGYGCSAAGWPWVAGASQWTVLLSDFQPVGWPSGEYGSDIRSFAGFSNVYWFLALCTNVEDWVT
jgi:hypothetical protein